MRVPSPRTTPEEEWRPILAFPGYEVSSHGRVRSIATDRILAVSVNQKGQAHVGPVRDGKQVRRVVSLLVAEAFLPEPPSAAYDTAVHLDNDKLNNYASNLVWRPRWFAIKYTQQFASYKLGPAFPVQDMESGEMYNDVWDVATTYGLLVHDIRQAAPTRSQVWPTRQRFRYVA